MIRRVKREDGKYIVIGELNVPEGCVVSGNVDIERFAKGGYVTCHPDRTPVGFPICVTRAGSKISVEFEVLDGLHVGYLKELIDNGFGSSLSLYMEGKIKRLGDSGEILEAEVIGASIHRDSCSST